MPVDTQTGRYFMLEVAIPSRNAAPLPAGVLLVDPSTDRLYIRLRRDWEHILPEQFSDEAEVLAELESDLANKAGETGAAAVLEQLSGILSNFLRISDPSEILVGNFERSLERLYRQNVAATVQPYVTHLPRFSLAVAAGKFLENQEITEEAWEEIPAGIRLDDSMFLARIAGHSMEPRIPDGSLCIFRAGVTGSRHGRLVLVEALGRGSNDRHTVKRYTSEKVQNPDGTWQHERIRLEPLNHQFEAWDLDPDDDRYRIVGEFVQVLD